MSNASVDSSVDLSVNLGPLKLSNPTVTVSGTCGYGDEYSPFVDLARLGAFTTKSVTLKPRRGNPPTRIIETASGMLNAIGLANVGLERFCEEKLPVVTQLGIPTIVNVAGHTVDEYLAVCERLDADQRIDALELNVSCPNVSDGLVFGTDAEALGDLVKQVRQVVKRSLLIIKLSPNVTDICTTARAAVDGGADCLSLVNTFIGMAVDIDLQQPILANTTGGLSGPAIKPMALNLVRRVYSEVAKPANVPLIGMGGVSNWRDAVEFMMVGATAVGIGTAMFVDPTTPVKIADGIAEFLKSKGMTSVNEIIGCLKPRKVKMPSV